MRNEKYYKKQRLVTFYNNNQGETEMAQAPVQTERQPRVRSETNRKFIASIIKWWGTIIGKKDVIRKAIDDKEV